MLLDRIDIDAHGPLTRVELGPFAEHINVVLGPEGSGKTAIARFVRDSLCNRRYPLGMLSSSTGRVVWAAADGLVHCRREKDGSTEGRRTVEFESRGDGRLHFDPLESSWMSGVSTTTDSSRAMRSIQIPESIVDCVVTDTSITNVARVVSACVRAGLDNPATYQGLPLNDLHSGRTEDFFADSSVEARQTSDRSRTLRAELADVEAELSRFSVTDAHYASLSTRREVIVSRLRDQHHRSTLNDRAHVNRNDTQNARHTHLQTRLMELNERADRLRAHEEQLSYWISDIDRDPRVSHVATSRVDEPSIHPSVRRRLDDFNAQLIRMRRALSEVRGLQALIDQSDHVHPVSTSPLDDLALRRRRLEGFAHAIDRYDYRTGWDRFYGEAYKPLGAIDDIHVRIEAATRQIDWLLNRYANADASSDSAAPWHVNLPASLSYGDATTIADTLRAIRSELDRVRIERYPLDARSVDYGDADTRYPEAGYSESRYSEPRYPESRYAESRYAESRYPESRYPEARFPEARYSERRYADVSSPMYQSSDYRRASRQSELRQSEAWLVGTIDHLIRHRNAVLDEASRLHVGPSYVHASDSVHAAWSHPVWHAERNERSAELQRARRELNACLNEAAEVRRQMRQLPVLETVSRVVGEESWFDRDALTAELHDIDRRLAGAGRRQWLTRRRAELLDALRVVRRPVRTASPLADHASRWLVRLSAGRLTRIDWSGNHVRIQGVDETQSSQSDRALAVLAVRMAAGDLLAKTGRGVPLVIETPTAVLNEAYRSGVYTSDSELTDSHLDSHWGSTAWALRQHSLDGRSNHPLAAALFDYSRAGRQVLVLTGDQSLADEISRVGGRMFRLHTQQVVHAHRPVWRSNERTANYVGPHVHTNDYAALDHETSINRDFDVAWREAYGFYDAPSHFETTQRVRTARPSDSGQRTDLAPDGVDCRDGYYHGNVYTTQHTENAANHVARDGRWIENTANGTCRNCETHNNGIALHAGRQEAAQNPFFLTVDSPIDQAPSIDSVAAARLRGLSITHITHLMRQDANRLADSLGLANVDAATIRRWQSECRLVCRVPQLRGFDARILVGCGITDPAQLAAIPPNDLLVRVQTFLATERGQQILLSGTSYELSRITRWIASANRSVNDAVGGVVVDGKRVSARLVRDADDFDTDRYEYDADGNRMQSAGTRRRRIVRTHHADGRVTVTSDDDITGRLETERARVVTATGSRSVDATYANGGYRSGARSGSTERDRNSQRTQRARGVSEPTQFEPTQHQAKDSTRQRDRSDRRDSKRTRRVERTLGNDSEYARTSRNDESRSLESRSLESRASESEPSIRVASDRGSRDRKRSSRESTESSTALRFYLHRESPVVDAPSIGPRMAERLSPLSIYTVDDLLNADPSDVASELGHSKIDETVVRSWQQQAELVCRVPMLRGHDAQILVASGVKSAEELANCDAQSLFRKVDPISNSREGKRILRGGSIPDLSEVTEWINYASQHRDLMAA